MSEQIITKQCSRCKEIKPLSEFYKNKSHRDGYQTPCKMCRKEIGRKQRQEPKYKAYKRAYQSQWVKTEKGKANSRKTTRRFRLLHPGQIAATRVVNNAIKSGKLPRPQTLQCSCGEQAVHYHHHKGYESEHWLDVIPVCKKCHLSIHSLAS